MNWLFIAIAAQIILGTSAVFDKLLLRRQVFDPLVYTFWLGTLGLFGFILLPFGSFFIPAATALIALLSGAIFIMATLALFYALHKSEASVVFAAIAALSPIFTFGFARPLLNSRFTGTDAVGFGLLILGGTLFFTLERKEARRVTIILITLSAILLGASNVLAKLVFDAAPFIPAFLWIKIGGFLAVLIFVAIPRLRERIRRSRSAGTQRQFLYLANRAYAGVGSLLIVFAISLAHPALVDATQSLKYVIIFIAAWLLLGERPRGRGLLTKVTATILIMLGFLWLGLTDYARSIPVDPNRPITWGVTFSSKFSKQLGLDWQKNLEAIFSEMSSPKIRLVAYWDDVEKQRGIFDFSELDWQMDRAAGAGTVAVLTIGMRVPRWPECHIPAWAESLDTESREAALRSYLHVMIERYRNHPALAVWQLENEPFLPFGICPERERQFFEKELARLRSLDAFHPVLVTDSGEFGGWYKAVRAGDIFGTTMYRKVYPPSIGWFVGEIEYPIGPSFFRLRQRLARWLTGEREKPFIVAELQSEPWGRQLLQDVSYKEQVALFSPEYFRDTIQYARDAGFDEYYLWGAEWWWFVKERHDDSRYWDIAKTVFRGQ